MKSAVMPQRPSRLRERWRVKVIRFYFAFRLLICFCFRREIKFCLITRKDWKRISAEASLVSPRRPRRSKEWTYLTWTCYNTLLLQYIRKIANKQRPTDWTLNRPSFLWKQTPTCTNYEANSNLYKLSPWYDTFDCTLYDTYLSANSTWLLTHHHQ